MVDYLEMKCIGKDVDTEHSKSAGKEEEQVCCKRAPQTHTFPDGFVPNDLPILNLKETLLQHVTLCPRTDARASVPVMRLLDNLGSE